MSEEFIADLSNYKDRTGSRLTPGRYRVQVEDAELTKAAVSGNTMVVLFLRVLGGEFDGSTMVDRLVITENSMFRLVGFMQAINLPTPRKRLKMNTRQFIGKSLEVDVDDGEPYNGRVKSEIRGYLKVAGGQSVGEDLPGDDGDDMETVSDSPGDESPETSTVPETDSNTLDLEEVDL